jgi:hypothetical protein
VAANAVRLISIWDPPLFLNVVSFYPPNSFLSL